MTSGARSGIIHFAFWRRSSVGQSIRFIPGVSPVRIQSPLPPGRPWRPGALWPVGQVVKTPPFHGGNMGSNPVRVTNFICGGLAQQVRAPASHAGGHWFESSSLHQGTAAELSFRGCVFLFPYANFARWCAHFTRLLFWRSKWCIFRAMHYGGECLNETQPAYRFARIGAHRLSAARWCLGRRAGTARLQRRRYHHHR